MHRRLTIRPIVTRRPVARPLAAAVLVFVCAVSVFAAGASDTASSSAESEPPVLRFGSLPAISALPIIYADRNGLFAEEGVDVEVVPFNSPTDRNVAMQTAQIDAFVGDVMTAITFRSAGFPVVVTSDIAEDFKLLGAPGAGITSVADLDGRSVSLVPGFVLEYIMDVIARENDVDYEIVIIPSISARFEALLSGEIAAVLFTEPQASLLAAAGATVLAGSLEYGIRAGAMIFREEYVAENEAAVKAFYRAYSSAARSISGTDWSEHAGLLAAYGFPANVADAVRGVVEIPSAGVVPVETIEDVIAWMKSKGSSVGIMPDEITAFGVLPR